MPGLIVGAVAVAALRRRIASSMMMDGLTGAARLVVIGRVVGPAPLRSGAAVVVIDVMIGVVGPVAEGVDLGVASSVAVLAVFHRRAHVREGDTAFERLQGEQAPSA